MRKLLVKSQTYCKIDERVVFDHLFDEDLCDAMAKIEANTGMSLETRELHERLLYPCYCCRKGFEYYRRVCTKGDTKIELKLSSYVIALIFMQPSFFENMTEE